MYAVIRGRETIAHKKALPVKVEASAASTGDEAAMTTGWMRWVLPAAGVLLVAALALAVYQVLPESRTKPAQASNRNRGGELPEETEKQDEKPKTVPELPKQPPEEKSKLPVVPSVEKKGPVKEKAKEKERPAVEVEHSAPPSTQRVRIGSYAGSVLNLPQAVVTRGVEAGEGKDEKAEWKLVKPRTAVYSSDTYAALPGFVGVITTTSGAGLLLRGEVREFAIAPVMFNLLESAVVLHQNDKFDLDLTLLRGRIFLTNRKEQGSCKVRLRFESEVWDVTLMNQGDEVCVDLVRAYTPVTNWKDGEAARAQCYLAVLRGEVGLRIDAYHTYNIEVDKGRWARMEYDSFTKTKGPFGEKQIPASMSKTPPSPETMQDETRRKGLQRMTAALADLQAMLSTKTSPMTALQETLEKVDPAARLLAIYCLASLDEVGRLIDSLGDGDPVHWPDRQAAYFALQRWDSRSPAQSKILYDSVTGSGVLIDKKFKKREADEFIKLLHPVLAENLGKEETYRDLAYDLAHSRTAIAEMAFWQLLWLSPGVKLPANFNAAAPLEDRERYSAEILRMIERKQLPPSAPATPATAPEEKKPKEPAVSPSN